MPLVLNPDLSAETREAVEAHLEEVRARRMVATIQYYSGVNAKLEHLSARLKRRLKSQYEMLGKEIATLERADEKVTKRLNDIANLENEQSLNDDQMVILDKEGSEDE